ncbi:MAG TPA: methyltransferase type 12, partial [Planctomycetota bacterium]|nr:methyltransferase type 12 [Planctomycetota bacterium]
MYGRRKVDDTVRYWKAVASNALAARAPALYVRLTGETGRGRETRSPQQLADYFLRCRAEQDAVLGLDAATAPGFYRDLAVMEYGPGDCPGFALCHLAAGARSVTCVDRFPLVKLSPPNVETLRALMTRFGD